MVVNQEFACNEEINVLPHSYAATDTDFFQVNCLQNFSLFLGTLYSSVHTYFFLKYHSYLEPWRVT